MRAGRTLALAAAFFFTASSLRAARPERRVLLAEYSGIISPVAAEYMVEAVRRAEDEGFTALILQLDTPGGLDLSMRQAIKAIMAAKVPVIVYVAPSGARAASAGVFITMAAHVAAMAPGTNIGAAHPVMIGGSKAEEKDETMEKKVTSDAVAYLKSIARRRGRNEDWAAKAVSQSSSTPAEEAVDLGIVDLVAENAEDLLEKVDGRRVEDLKTNLHTEGAEIVRMQLSGRQKLLAALSDPNIAVILMSVGAAGIFIEMYNPGLILPGIVGVFSLVLAFYSFQTLSANFAGVVLLFFGFLLFILEIKVASYGLLTVGGILALLLGFLMLFNQPSAMGLSVDWTVIASTILGLVSITAALAWVYAAASRKKPETGAEELLGMEGLAQSPLNPEGRIFVHGELWAARSEDGEIPEGAPIRVTGQKGLTLLVKKRP